MIVQKYLNAICHAELVSASLTGAFSHRFPQKQLPYNISQPPLDFEQKIRYNKYVIGSL